MVKCIKEKNQYTLIIVGEDLNDEKIENFFPNVEICEIEGLEAIKPIFGTEFSFADLPQMQELIKKTSDPIRKRILFNKAISICQEKFGIIVGHEKDFVQMITEDQANHYGKYMAFLFYQDIRGTKTVKEALLKILLKLSVTKPLDV